MPTNSKIIKSAIKEVFLFASDGKRAIANAITGMGVNTNINDSLLLWQTISKK